MSIFYKNFTGITKFVINIFVIIKNNSYISQVFSKSIQTEDYRTCSLLYGKLVNFNFQLHIQNEMIFKFKCKWVFF